jgi:hypothetical protein
MLLPPCSRLGESDLEAAAAEPRENGCCGCRLSCLGGATIKKVLGTSGFLAFVRSTLVEKTLATSSLLSLKSGFLVEKACSLLAGSLLAFVGGTLVKKALAVSGLLFFASSFLAGMALAGRRLKGMALVLPHGVDCPLPIPVVAFRAGVSPM